MQQLQLRVVPERVRRPFEPLESPQQHFAPSEVLPEARAAAQRPELLRPRLFLRKPRVDRLFPPQPSAPVRWPVLLVLAFERPEALETLVQHATDLEEPALHLEQS